MGELGIPVWVSVRPEGLPHVMVPIKQFPQVRIVVDHMIEAKSALAVLPMQDQEWIFARTAQSLYPVLADK